MEKYISYPANHTFYLLSFNTHITYDKGSNGDFAVKPYIYDIPAGKNCPDVKIFS